MIERATSGGPATLTRPAIQSVEVLRLGEAEAHHEHVHGSRAPALWWILFGRRRVPLPINAYLVEHSDGLVLFDTGQDRAVVTEPDYYPDPVTGFLSRRLIRWHLGPEDTLTSRLERAGRSAADVRKVVVSHLHSDHVGGIAELPQAELYAAEEGFAYMRGPEHPERFMVYRERIELPGAKWRTIEFQPTDDPELAPFTEAFDLMGDGSLTVLPTPGHLAGSVSMLVRSADRPPLLFVGDLTYSDEMLERDELPGTGDPHALGESFARVRALKAHMPDLVLLPAHDSAAPEKLRRAML